MCYFKSNKMKSAKLIITPKLPWQLFFFFFKMPQLKPETISMTGLNLFQHLCNLARLATSAYDGGSNSEVWIEICPFIGSACGISFVHQIRLLPSIEFIDSADFYSEVLRSFIFWVLKVLWSKYGNFYYWK